MPAALIIDRPEVTRNSFTTAALSRAAANNLAAYNRMRLRNARQIPGWTIGPASAREYTWVT
ncbi:hypothetical protein [Streptomyces sp. NPDC059753]|uniref:hypothetical protein n=1 Tax=Streptomyces sp. NPDC059753 TaxID=3346933 RepID=UPI00364A2C24